LVHRLGSENLVTDEPVGDRAPVHGVDIRSNFAFNTGIAGLDEADFVILIGTNPRHEASIINTRLRKGYLHNGLDLALIGEKVDLTYDYDHLGTDAIWLHPPPPQHVPEATGHVKQAPSSLLRHPRAARVSSRAIHAAQKSATRHA